MTEPIPVRDGETMSTVAGGQHWLVSWHPADARLEGRPHGAAGICAGNDRRDLVLISPDGVHWGFPAGRPEGAETMRETLVREMREEACVEVLDAWLLGFSRSECVQGREEGLVLIRSYWFSEVRIEPWVPRFEIVHRRIVAAPAATDAVKILSEWLRTGGGPVRGVSVDMAHVVSRTPRADGVLIPAGALTMPGVHGVGRIPGPDRDAAAVALVQDRAVLLRADSLVDSGGRRPETLDLPEIPWYVSAHQTGDVLIRPNNEQGTLDTFTLLDRIDLVRREAILDARAPSRHPNA